MAQTKKRRQTKHRGNAAGVVEARGRTGRKLTEDERKGSSGGKDPRKRGDRLDKPPTWRGAINRSLVAVVIFVAVLVLFFKQDARSTVSLGAVLLLVYVPISYYLDLYLYRRREAKKAAASPTKAPKGED